MCHKASETPAIDLEPERYSSKITVWYSLSQTKVIIRLIQSFRNLQHMCTIALINSSLKDELLPMVQFCGLLSHQI